MQVRTQGGFSMVAALIIGAVVVIGGAVLISSNNEADVETDTDQPEVGEQVTYECPEGPMLSARLTSETEAEVTLPDGSVTTLTQVEADGERVYQNNESNLEFATDGATASLSQDGEVVLDRCERVEEETTDDGTATSEDGMEAGVEVDAGVEADLDTELDTEMDDEIDALDMDSDGDGLMDAENEAGADNETSAEGDADTSADVEGEADLSVEEEGAPRNTSEDTEDESAY